MIDLRPVAYILGYLLLVLSASMVPPMIAAFSFADGESFGFGASIAITAMTGMLLLASQRRKKIDLNRHQAFLLTSLAWLVLPVFGALPFNFSGLHLSIADSLFESVSGITTTGSTILSGLDTMAPSILLWRSVLQWIGGIGIIAMGIAILPFLRVGGMQIFRTESSDRSDKAMPRAGQFAVFLVGVYIGLSVLCALAYDLAGMTTFEAINHAMTTISTGGYSTSDGSMGHFEAPSIHWISVLFMLLGGLPFVIYIQTIRGRPMNLLKDSQGRTLVGFLFAVSVILSVWLTFRQDIEWIDAFRLAALNVTSIVTTTGYASADYTLWGPFSVIAFFLLTFVGGCSGSTSGGIKIYRFQLLYGFARAAAQRLISPHAVHILKYNGKPVGEEINASVGSFIILFLSTIVLLWLALAALGLDFQTALSSAATAVTNVGPGLGPIVGPAGNFSSLPDSAKYLLDLGMVAGRLEIMTLLVIATPYFWKG